MNRSDPVTELSGVGPATAEKLKENGINTVGDAIDEFQRGGRRLPNKRVTNAVRDAVYSESVEQGEIVDDPTLGVTVTPNNRGAVEFFADKQTGTDAVDNFGRFSRESGSFDGDTSLLDLGARALRGDLKRDVRAPDVEDLGSGETSLSTNQTALGGEKENKGASAASRARYEAYEFGLDVAANISPFEREEIQRGNKFADTIQSQGLLVAEQETTEERETGGGVIDAAEKMRLQSREYARAVRIHNQRSPEAQEVDNRRKAPVTDEITTWSEDPSHWDYPGVDTPGGRNDFLNEGRADDKGTAETIFEAVQNTDETVQRIGLERSSFLDEDEVPL